ncbi:MAG: adenosylmethionine decarboxylase [Dehalococcoidia bacterium]|nr:adenosylmethionine decarboxylase [Dehalococcoidia bacterium]
MHLIIDGYARDRGKIMDKEFIREFLDTYPQQIQMTKVSTPKVSQYQDSEHQEQGISGFVLLAESHISIHVFPESSYINIDVFSCKDFDPEQVVRGLEQQFGLADVKSYILNRPHSITE